MKHGTNPTLEQKKILKAHGLCPDEYLIVKEFQDALEVVSRTELRKMYGRPRTRRITRDL